MKLLFLSPFLYHSKVGHGGGVACYQLLQMLAPRHEIHLLAFVSKESEEDIAAAQSDLAPLCHSVHTVRMDVSPGAVMRAKLKFLTQLRPIDAELFAVPAMAAKLRELVASLRPDVVFVQFPQMAQYAADCAPAATVMDVQDAFSVSGYRKYRSQAAPLKKLGMFFNWWSWLGFETRYYPQFDAVAAVTEQDRIGLEIFSPGLGADVIRSAITLDSLPTPAKQTDVIGFIGSFAHYPNVEGVRYLIEQVFPRIQARRPGVRLQIAGGNPPQVLLNLRTEHIEFLGFVPDANAFMRSVTVMTVPLLSGGGVKIKTLHAMACACPIVSTSIGVEEIGALHDTHALIADTSEQFAAEVLRCLDDAEMAARLGEQAQRLVAAQFSWDAKLAAAERVLQRAVQTAGARLR